MNYETTLVVGTTVATTISRASQGARAYSIAFDYEANVIGETDSTLYIDYCHAEIVALEIFKLFPEIDPELPWVVVSEIGLGCDCD